MSLPAIITEMIIDNPDAGVMLGLAVYLAYEIRFGMIREVENRQEQAAEERRVMGIAVYKIVKGDGGLDEDEFRSLLWGDNGEVFPSDMVDQPGDQPTAEAD